MPESFGLRLARLRASRGWTQQALAERLALSRVAVSHFEMGQAVPSERTIILLAGLFRLEPHELVAGTFYPEGKALRLPAVAARYTEAELQLALLERDLAWAEAGGPAGGPGQALLAEWRERLAALHDASGDERERGLLLAAIGRLAALKPGRP